METLKPAFLVVLCLILPLTLSCTKKDVVSGAASATLDHYAPGSGIVGEFGVEVIDEILYQYQQSKRVGKSIQVEPVKYDSSNISTCLLLNQDEEVTAYSDTYTILLYDCDGNGQADHKSYAKRDGESQELRVQWVEEIMN